MTHIFVILINLLLYNIKYIFFALKGCVSNFFDKNFNNFFILITNLLKLNLNIFNKVSIK